MGAEPVSDSEPGGWEGVFCVEQQQVQMSWEEGSQVLWEAGGRRWWQGQAVGLYAVWGDGDRLAGVRAWDRAQAAGHSGHSCVLACGGLPSATSKPLVHKSPFISSPTLNAVTHLLLVPEETASLALVAFL